MSLSAVLVGGCGDDPESPTPRQQPNLPPLERPCDSDSECPAGRCDPLKGCVECLFDHDCDSGAACTGGVCTAIIPCQMDAQCSVFSGACDTTAGKCVTCVNDGDCAENSRCTEQQCVPFQPCVNSLDCMSGTVCNRNRGECVGCVNDSDCLEEQTCQQDACVPRCESDKECQAQGLLCGSGGFCVQCAVPVDCPSVYHCTAEGHCKLDVCEASHQTCNPFTHGIETCNDDGSATTAELCGARQSCNEIAGVGHCADWICEPGQTRCNPLDNSIEHCANDGLTLAEDTPCADNQVCLANQCTDKICEPLATFCLDGNPHTCGFDGASSTLLATCSADQFCNGGRCSPDVCTADALACDGDLIKRCNAEGSAFEIVTDCTDTDEVCWQAACAPKICDNNTYSCQGNTSYQCTNNGTVEQFSMNCTGGYFCNVSNGQCAFDVCTASTPACDDEVAKTCNADGSGFDPGGMDCEASGQRCWQGDCLDVVCNTTYFCQSNAVYYCQNNGTSGLFNFTCTGNTHCDAAAGNCAQNICTPNSPVCNGSFATTCNADGSGYVPGGTNCAASGTQACFSGTCLPKICEPNAYFCENDNVMRCGPEGVSSTLYQDCLASQFCTPGDASCNTDVCTGGTAVCNGDTLTTCKADGSGPEAGGTNCTTNGQVCDQAACRPVICAASQYFCNAGNVHLCNAKGWASATYDTCTTAEFCDATQDPAACWWDVCTANASACSGESLATCNSDGSGYSATTTNCASTNQVCDLTLGCIASAVDTVGAAGTSLSATSDMFGEFFKVLKNRSLTTIEAYASVSGISIFNWVVYSSDTMNGTYTKVFQSTNTSSGAGFVYHSSGAIDFDLVAGKYYFIGAHVTGVFSYSRQSATPVRPVSFGQVLSSLLNTSDTVLPSLSFSTSTTYTYPIRLTTAP